MPVCRVLLLLLSLSIMALAEAGELKGSGPEPTQDQQAKALERINGYLHAYPENAQAMFVRAVILADQGRRTEAIQAFSEITEKYPGLPEPYNNLATLYAEQGQYDKAREVLETAIQRVPGDPLAYENLGNIYLKLAAGVYEKAMPLNNDTTRMQDKLLQIKALLPAPTATTADKASTKTSTDEADINSSIALWAKAWSAKDWTKYFACYADSFRPPNGMTRFDWEQSRRLRMSKAEMIQVQVSQLEVSLGDLNTAKVSFLQSYRETHIATRTKKTLMLRKINQEWLIEQELENHGTQPIAGKTAVKD